MVSPADEIRRNIEEVRENLASAARRSGRKPDDILLMGVTKFQPIESIYFAIEAGLVLFGENRVQERDEKNSKWEGTKAEWHMIGHLQRNKARRATELFDCIESVDSIELAAIMERALNEGPEAEQRTGVYPVMIEVNTSGEKSKHGVSPENCFALMEDIAVKCPHIQIAGLMTIGPLTSDEKIIAESFSLLRKLRDEARKKLGFPLPHLSMGMSGDYAVAIEEGSTIVRIGTAIFGGRHS
jgi:pyridoxal phosphate enzyme (YggS family)